MAMEEEEHKQEQSSCVEIPKFLCRPIPGARRQRGIEQNRTGEAVTEAVGWEPGLPGHLHLEYDGAPLQGLRMRSLTYF